MKTKKIQIKDLKQGMRIKTLDANQETVFREVTKKWNTTVPTDKQVRLEFENKVILNCSTNHPIMVLADGEFTQKTPVQLTPDDKVLTEAGFTRILTVDVGQSNDDTYIDIEVEQEHTFFASSSENGPMVLTHNSQGGIRNACVSIDSYVNVLEGFEFEGHQYMKGEIITSGSNTINITNTLLALAYMRRDDEREAYLQNLFNRS